MVENVCAQEVEDVLRKHPAVFDCALIGVEDQRFGEAVQLLREKLDQKNVYFMNPALDM